MDPDMQEEETANSPGVGSCRHLFDSGAPGLTVNDVTTIGVWSKLRRTMGCGVPTVPIGCS
jgi:hypothetical protein